MKIRIARKILSYSLVTLGAKGNKHTKCKYNTRQSSKAFWIWKHHSTKKYKSKKGSLLRDIQCSKLNLILNNYKL